jgi:hypothetical protein
MHTHYTRFIPPQDHRNFVKPEGDLSEPVQLCFPFMADTEQDRDPHAPDMLALKIVRGIFEEGVAGGWDMSRADAVTKIHTHREHTPPPGMTERRATARQEEPTQPTLRQAMRAPTQRVDLSQMREVVLTPGYMMPPPDHAAPLRRLGIMMAVIVCYFQVLTMPETVRGGWQIVGQFFGNVQMIATKLQTEGIKGTASYRGGVPTAAAGERR